MNTISSRAPGVDPRVEAILHFWFGDLDRGLCTDERRQALFRADAALDREIAQRFGEDVERALAGQLDHWAATATGRLALVVMLDQLTRNIFRGTARAYAGDDQALEFAREGVGRGDDRMLPLEPRVFLYLPFEHSEYLADQNTCVVLLEGLAQSEESPDRRAVVEQYLDYARGHREIVRRFHRFPHRNTVLDRASTAEEQRWLGDDRRRFGQ